jgi:hypothetical protein
VTRPGPAGHDTLAGLLQAAVSAGWLAGYPLTPGLLDHHLPWAMPGWPGRRPARNAGDLGNPPAPGPVSTAHCQPGMEHDGLQ